MEKNKRKVKRTAFWFGSTAIPLSLIVIVVAVVGIAGVTISLVSGFSLANLFGETTSSQSHHGTPSHSVGPTAHPSTSASPTPSASPSASPSPSSSAGGGASGDSAKSGNSNSGGGGTASGTGVNGGEDVDVQGSTSSVILAVVAGTGPAISLRPGSSFALNLSFANQSMRAVTVDNIAVTVASISAPSSSPAFNCSVSDFYVTQISPTFTLRLAPAGNQTLQGQGTQASNWPVVGMLDSTANQDGCKGATLTLAYTAWGHN